MREAQPNVVTSLLLKKVEVEAQVVSLTDRLAEAKADLFHVVAAVRLFDPTLVDRPATAYHAVTRAMTRKDVLALCFAALEAAPDGLNTWELARHVIVSEGWDANDRRLKLAVAAKVGNALGRMAKRRAVVKLGLRDQATVWTLPADRPAKARR